MKILITGDAGFVEEYFHKRINGRDMEAQR
jgi:hypothetical protein